MANLPVVTNTQVNCQNCENPHDESFDFCPYCGQKTNDELTIGVLFYNTISNYFSFDARFLKSFLPLLLKPGFLAKEFIKGKRLLYLHPAQMFLFVSVVFFFLFSFTVNKGAATLNNEFQDIFDKDGKAVLDSTQTRKRDSLKQINDSIARKEVENALRRNKYITGMSDKDIDSIIKFENLPNKSNISYAGINEKDIDSLIQNNASDAEILKALGQEDDDGWLQRKWYAQVLKFFKLKDGGNILKAIYDSIPIALFFLLPIFALILKLLYIRKGRYAHHLVFSFYYFTFLFVVFSIICGVNMIWDIPDWLDWLIALSTFIYLLIASRRFYGQGRFLTFLKTCVATFTFMLIIIPTATVIVGLVAFMFY